MKLIDNRTEENKIIEVDFGDIAVGSVFRYEGMYFIKIRGCWEEEKEKADAVESIEYFNAFRLMLTGDFGDTFWWLGKTDKVEIINAILSFENCSSFEAFNPMTGDYIKR